MPALGILSDTSTMHLHSRRLLKNLIILLLAVNIINFYNELTTVNIRRIGESSNGKDTTFNNNEGGLRKLSSQESYEYIEHPPLEQQFDQKRKLFKSRQENGKDCFIAQNPKSLLFQTCFSTTTHRRMQRKKKPKNEC